MIERFFKLFSEWASDNPNIDSILLVGSYAREQAKDDSDVDLVILCNNPNSLINNLEWIEQFGEIISFQKEDWGAVQSIRAYYKNLKEIEFGITSIDWAKIPIDSGTREVIANGAKIILDKNQLLKNLLN